MSPLFPRPTWCYVPALKRGCDGDNDRQIGYSNKSENIGDPNIIIF